MINLTDDVKQKYNVSQVADYDGSIKLVLTLKKRTCKCCGKVFEAKGREFLLWRTRDNHSVSGWFCRRHYIQAKKLIELLK